MLRIISCAAVILLHVNANFYVDRAINDGIFLMEGIINFLTRFSVPCFVMISGAFNLGRKQRQDVKQFYFKSVVKLVLPWMEIYIVWILAYIVEGNLSGALKSAVKLTAGNLWFMPMIFMLYFLSPWLDCVLGLLNEKELKAGSIILLAWAIVSKVAETDKLPYAMGVVFPFFSYYIFGYMLKKVNTPHISFLLLCLVTVCLVSVTIVFRMKGYKYYELNAFTAFFSPTVVIYSIIFFLYFKDIHININLEYAAKMTFYIYLAHTIVYKVLLKVTVCFIRNELVHILTITVGTCVISYVISILWNYLHQAFLIRMGLVK